MARYHRATLLRLALAVAALIGVIAVHPRHAMAGGGPENAVLIVDPTNDESLYIANHYRAARGIPETNVLYMAPGADDYQDFAAFQIDALLGSLSTRGLTDHIDYVIVPPGGPFFIPMEGLVDGNPCPRTVMRMATSSAYTLAFTRDDILAGSRTYSEPNRFFGRVDDPIDFSSNTAYYNGVPDVGASARRYYVGFMLGYSGPRGNTTAEIKDMIDRSVAADGTLPDGTFYFVRTTDVRSTPRHGYFPGVIAAIERLGGLGEELFTIDDKEVLVPAGRHDILGVATGHASPPIDSADMTILPGAFADHITSFAATFDTGGQTKMSRWIANGASGSMGTVEEPCVFGEGVTGKFPHPRLHVWYFQGMSLGESLLRSIQWAPYQGLFVGDPLTRPFGRFPEVEVLDMPAGPASGVVTLSPVAVGAGPLTGIAALDLFVDGRRQATIRAGESFRLDTTVLADGAHDLRVVAYDSTPVRNQGRWLGALLVDNAGRSATTRVGPREGELDTLFHVDVSATGGPVAEIRLMEGTRVVAATRQEQDTFDVRGKTLGAGDVSLRAEVEYEDGRLAVSPAATVQISFTVDAMPIGEPAPVAYDVTVDALPGEALVLNLPALDPSGFATVAEVVQQPDQATVDAGANALLLRPDVDARGSDTLLYRAVSGEAQSEPATATIRYCEAAWVVARPVPVEACAGASATFRVVAGGERLSYQWFKDDVPLAGAIDSALVVRDVGPADVGAYRVEVTGRCGTIARRVSSASAPLTLIDDPDRCRSAVWLPYAVAEMR